MTLGWAGSRLPPYASAIRGSTVCSAGPRAAGCGSSSCGVATWAARRCSPGSGCQEQSQGQGQDGSAPPPARRSPPPSLRGGAGRAQERGRGRAAPRRDCQGAPCSAGMRQPVCHPGGRGLLSVALTRQVHSSGGGGAQPPTAAPISAGADGGAHSPRFGPGRSSEDPT